MNKIFTTILTAGAFAAFLPVDSSAAAQRLRLSASDHQLIPATTAAAPATAAERRNTPIRRATAGGSNIYGYLYYSDNEESPIGLYNLDPAGYSLVWEDPLVERAAELYTGWLRNGILSGVALQVTESGQTLAYIVQSDFYTGDIFDIKPIKAGGSYFTLATLNEKDGYVYGVATSRNGYSFSKAASGAPDDVTPICEADNEHNFCSITYNPDDGKLYGINLDMNFVTVDTDGTVNVLTPVKLPKPAGDYQTALIYSSTEKRFYWNVNYADDTAALYTIDPNGYRFELVENYKYCESFSFFLSPDGKADPSLPKSPEFVSADFGNGETSGKVVFRMPDTTEGGQPLEGDLQWTAYLGLKEHASGTAKPGADVTLNFENLPEGRASVMMSVRSGDKESLRGRQSIFIGKDVPKAPASVTLSADGTISWPAVTEGVNYGYIDLSTLRYKVTDKSGKLLATVTEPAYKVTLPADAPMEAYRYSVTAEYGDGTYSSEPTWSNYEIAGRPFTAPAHFAPTLDESLLFTIADVNGDERGWAFDDGMADGSAESFKCYYSMQDSDDWLFLPAIDMKDPMTVYTVAFESRLLVNRFDKEYIQVFAGDSPTPEAMTTPLGGIFTPSASFSETAAYYVPANPGVKYIGIHCTSEADMAGVALREFKITAGDIDIHTPQQPSEVTLTEAAEGRLSATATLTLPRLDLSGAELSADSKLKATVQNLSLAAKETSVEGKPGETVSIEFATLQGDNNILLTVTSGELTCVPLERNIFTGVHAPGKIEGLKAELSSDMMSVTLSWDPVTKGEGGTYLDPSQVTYTVSMLQNSFAGTTWNPVDSDISVTNHTLTLPVGSAQQYLTLGVTATNEAGTCKEYAYLSQVMGTPYQLGMKEDFGNMESDEDFTLSPYVIAVPAPDYDSSWEVITPEQINPQLASQGGYYFVGYGEAGKKGRIGIPRFTTEKDNAVLSLSTLTPPMGIATIDVYAECEGVAPRKIGSVKGDGKLTPHTDTFILPEEFGGRKWVQLYFDCAFTENATLCAIRSFAVNGKTAVGEIAGAGPRVYAANGEIIVIGAEGEALTVYGADGRVAAFTSRAAAEQHFPLPAGLYIMNGKKILL